MMFFKKMLLTLWGIPHFRKKVAVAAERCTDRPPNCSHSNFIFENVVFPIAAADPISVPASATSSTRRQKPIGQRPVWGINRTIKLNPNHTHTNWTEDRIVSHQQIKTMRAPFRRAPGTTKSGSKKGDGESHMLHVVLRLTSQGAQQHVMKSTYRFEVCRILHWSRATALCFFLFESIVLENRDEDLAHQLKLRR